MFLLRFLLPLTVLLASLSAQTAEPAPAKPAEKIPVSVFTRAPSLSGLKLNPAGTCFAGLSCLEGERVDLLVYDLRTKQRQLHSASIEKERVDDIFEFAWLSDTRVLFGISNDKRYMRGLFSAEIQAMNKARCLVRRSVVDILGRSEDRPGEVLLWVRKDAGQSGRAAAPIRIDATKALHGASLMETLATEVLEEYPIPPEGLPSQYYPDAQGELRFALTTKEGLLQLWLLRGKTWMRSPLDASHWHVVCAAETEGELYAVPDPEPGKPSELVRLDAATGERREVLISSSRENLRDMVPLRAADRRLIGFTSPSHPEQHLWLDGSYKQLYTSILRRLPGMRVSVVSSDSSGSRLIILARSDVQPGDYHLYEREGDRLTRLGESRPWVESARMQPMRKISYQSRDGLRIEAFMTLPAGAKAGRALPVVVMPHGGPFVRDKWGWDPMVQFLASRGYAVFQPNYRGSQGYDWDMPAGDPLLFRRMSDDVADGVRFLIKGGVADPGRVAILGGSFGGYLALCGVVNDPELYRCAISLAGVFDWEKVMREAKRFDDDDRRYDMLRRSLGDPSQKPEAFDAIAPLRHLERVKVPVFVSHGTDDPVASLKESKALIAGLKRAGIPCEVQIEEGEGHGFRKKDNRDAFYERVEKFLEINLAPR